jgi:hypothetical protein
MCRESQGKSHRSNVIAHAGRVERGDNKATLLTLTPLADGLDAYGSRHLMQRAGM